MLICGKLDAYVLATLLRLLDGGEAWGRLLTAALSWEEKLALLDERVFQPRLSKDDERKVQTSETLLQLAMIRLMVRRLARSIG